MEGELEMLDKGRMASELLVVGITGLDVEHSGRAQPQAWCLCNRAGKKQSLRGGDSQGRGGAGTGNGWRAGSDWP